ncbi:hypothetical protein MWT71_000004 [Vibrio parahaemolyticus]|nr:hypothetical protein [Vibrio parahaemolyticus]EJA3300973.1 hypothetical protein [Vibrio parahaemolyticus]EJG0669621.1 hypothetical protein [Vibrio parahaemolyticus]
MKEIIESLLNGNIEIFVGIMTGVVSVLIALPMFRILERKKLFYSEESGRDIEERDRLRILEKEVVKLRKELSSDLLKNASKLIEQEISMYLSENIGRMTSEKLKESKVLEDRIFNEIEERVNSRIDLFLESKTDEDLAASKRENHLFQQRESVEKELFHTVEQERRSAGLLKSVMINLFVIVNFALIVLYLLKGSELSQYGALSLSGLYISLAGFIIYIFRASNARTSVLLAIKEDLKNNTRQWNISNTQINQDLSQSMISNLSES